MIGVGGWAYLAGANGTASVPKGARVLQIVIVGGAADGTLTIFGGASIPIPAGAVVPLRFPHDMVANASSQDIVTTNTKTYFIEYLKAGP